MFLVIRCKSAFEGILGRSFLARLNIVYSTFHLKIVYHDEEGILVTVGENLQEARRVGRIIRKDVLASEPRGSDEFGLDARDDEVRPTLDDDFDFVQLGENLATMVKIGLGLFPDVSSMLIKFLRANANIFSISPPDIPISIPKWLSIG
ncbi:unnamed protein product [Lathyrus oleraceus]